MTSATSALAQRCCATTEPTAPHPIRRTLGGSEGMLSNLSSNRGDGGPLALRGRGHKPDAGVMDRSEEHTSELQSRLHLVCRLLLEKKTKTRRRALDGIGRRPIALDAVLRVQIQ